MINAIVGNREDSKRIKNKIILLEEKVKTNEVIRNNVVNENSLGLDFTKNTDFCLEINISLVIHKVKVIRTIDIKSMVKKLEIARGEVKGK
jgi:hypothetical protein